MAISRWSKRRSWRPRYGGQLGRGEVFVLIVVQAVEVMTEMAIGHCAMARYPAATTRTPAAARRAPCPAHQVRIATISCTREGDNPVAVAVMTMEIPRRGRATEPRQESLRRRPARSAH